MPDVLIIGCYFERPNSGCKSEDCLQNRSVPVWTEHGPKQKTRLVEPDGQVPSQRVYSHFRDSLRQFPQWFYCRPRGRKTPLYRRGKKHAAGRHLLEVPSTRIHRRFQA